jgi:GAF domain-containing protein
VLGTFAILQHKPARPTPLQQDLIAQVTHIASIAIERAQGEAALKRSEAFLAEGQRLSLTGSFSWRIATDEITWSDQVYRIFETGKPSDNPSEGATCLRQPPLNVRLKRFRRAPKG